MRALLVAGALPVFVLAATRASASSPHARTEENTTGSVLGHVTIGGKPAPYFNLLLVRDFYGDRASAPSRTTSDAEGAFRFEAVKPATYFLVAASPIYVVAGGASASEVDLTVSVPPGEVVRDLAVQLESGSVITGQITNQDGTPAIAETVHLLRRDADGKLRQVFLYDWRRAQTDDRGAYRIFGLPPGAYIVSAGSPNDGQSVTMGTARRRPRQEYFSNGASVAEARRVQVASGAASARIDIVLPDPTETFSASGTVVDAESGAPVPNVEIGYGRMRGGTFFGAFGSTGSTDERGAFRVTGLSSGTYGLLVENGSPSGYISDPVPVEIASQDVKGIVVKVHHGARLSGRVVPLSGGEFDRRSLSGVLLFRATAEPETIPAWMGSASGQVKADETFVIAGIRTGRYEFGLFSENRDSAAALVRVEHEGLPQTTDVAISGTESLSGVSLIVGTGGGSVKGDVLVEGKIEGDVWIAVTRRPADSPFDSKSTGADDRRQLLLTGPVPGEYVVTPTAYIAAGPSGEKQVTG